MGDESIIDNETEAIIREMTQSKKTTHDFLDNVAKTINTTKVGYLERSQTIDELGQPKLPVRTFLDLSLFCEDIAEMKQFSEYFKKSSEIVTSSSLSREGFLIKAAITQNRTFSENTQQPRKPNKGWFKSKDDQQSSMDSAV